MRKLLVLAFLINLTSTGCYATRQVADFLLHEQDTFRIYQMPLQHYYNESIVYNPGFFPPYGTSSCWRSYRAFWRIKEGRLFLTAIYDCSLKYSFPIERTGIPIDENGMIWAYWFTGTFKINKIRKEELREPWNIGTPFIPKKIIKIKNGWVM